MKDLDRYLDPPDLPERVNCPECGEEMELGGYDYESHGKCGPPHFRCMNRFCPSKHDGIAKEMAIKILELEYDLIRLKGANMNKEQEKELIEMAKEWLIRTHVGRTQSERQAYAEGVEDTLTAIFFHTMAGAYPTNHMSGILGNIFDL